MTYRSSLILGLAIALPSAVLPAARGAESSARTAAYATTNSGTGGEFSSWKASDQAMGADIRFKKPEGIVFTDQLEEPKKKPATAASIAPATKPVAATATLAGPATPTAAIQSPAAIQAAIQSPAPAATTPIAIAQATTIPATTAPAATIAAPAAAAPTTPIAAAPATTATSAASATTPASAPTIHNDDQIQLVARLLMDQGVMRPADEEPLPASPNSNNGQSMRTHNGNNGNNPIGPDNGDCGCDDGSCGNCCPQPCLFWTGGVEATFLVPDLNTQNATFDLLDITEDREDFVSTEANDVDSMYVSPRIWLGVQGACWGANLRYWHLQASEGSYDPSLGSFGNWDGYDCGQPDIGFFSCSRLEAYTVDLELTRRFCLNNCWMQLSAGVRHAELWNSEAITGLALTDAGLLDGFARANRNSRGTGILLGLYGRKPIFPCSCVNWFYNARWSALWGETQTSAETFAAVQASDPQFTASAASVNGAYTTIDDTMFIGEIQLGLEWDYCLCCLPANAFFRVAVEYQRWDGGSGSSQANSFAGIEIQQQVDPTSIVSTNATADGPQMDLFGFTIGTGLTW